MHYVLPPPQNFTVLVVEDQFLLRATAVLLFEEADYTVLSAANADEAEIALETCPEISVLFTDIQMPGSMDGLALATKWRRLLPDLKILIVSGAIEPINIPARSLFLSKPYSAEQISSALSSLAALKSDEDVMTI